MSAKSKDKILTKTTYFGKVKVTLYSLDGATWSSRPDELEAIKERHEAQRITIAHLKGEAKGKSDGESEESENESEEKEAEDDTVDARDLIAGDDLDDDDAEEEEESKPAAVVAKGKGKSEKAAPLASKVKGKAQKGKESKKDKKSALPQKGKVKLPAKSTRGSAGGRGSSRAAA